MVWIIMLPLLIIKTIVGKTMKIWENERLTLDVKFGEALLEINITYVNLTYLTLAADIHYIFYVIWKDAIVTVLCLDPVAGMLLSCVIQVHSHVNDLVPAHILTMCWE